MSSTIGNNIKISIWGQSHSKAVGVTIDGLPVGREINMELLQKFMNRRAPGRNKYSTKRKEADKPIILSGMLDGKTCGAPLCAMIENTNTISGDYDNIRDHPRPGHADFTAQKKYKGFQDVSGGGHFSGRLTAPMCIAGGIAKQILEDQGIKVFARILQIGDVRDADLSAEFANLDQNDMAMRLENVTREDFPTLNQNVAKKMQDTILKAANEGDSVGGIIECVITNMPAGIGEPIFDGIEGELAKAIFGVPAVKGLEFGAGFKVAEMRGSENNDEFVIENGMIKTETNNHGGILGGISSGMEIVFRVAIKPTPSIAMTQNSISIKNKVEEELEIKGRHDPCIVLRAVPVIEAVAAFTLLDLMDIK